MYKRYTVTLYVYCMINFLSFDLICANQGGERSFKFRLYKIDAGTARPGGSPWDEFSK